MKIKFAGPERMFRTPGFSMPLQDQIDHLAESVKLLIKAADLYQEVGDLVTARNSRSVVEYIHNEIMRLEQLKAKFEQELRESS